MAKKVPFTLNVKAIRAKMNMDQKELGEKLGVSNVIISNMENGLCSVSEEQIKKLSEISGIPVEFISN